MSTDFYAVIVEQFAERHYIKNFAKKYKGAWDVTWKAVIEELKRIDSLFETSIAETISDHNSVKIIKTEFRVAGTRESRKGSGNRCVVAIHRDATTVHVLLVYHKNDLGNGNETVTWKNVVRAAYPEYKDLI